MKTHIIKAEEVKELVPSELLPNMIEKAKRKLIARYKEEKDQMAMFQRVAKYEIVFNARLNGETLTKIGEFVNLSRERVRVYEAKMSREVMKSYSAYKWDEFVLKHKDEFKFGGKK